MDYSTLNTVQKIADFTKKEVLVYRQFQSKKLTVAEALKPLFEANAEGWKIVIDMGKFRPGFTRVLGVNGMRALKKLLYVIDKKMYNAIDFGVGD